MLKVGTWICMVLLGLALPSITAGSSHRLTHLLLRASASVNARSQGNNVVREKRDARDAEEEERPIARSLSVLGRIEQRYAVTQITMVMDNPADTDKEAEFTVQIPETAFISNFTMIFGGEFFQAEIKGKEEAQEAYNEAKEQNQTAGQVSSRPRDLRTAARGMEIFSVAVNVAPNSSVQFNLTYQESLTRRLGLYNYIVSIRPQQIIDNINMSLVVVEPTGITQLSTSGPEQQGVTSPRVDVSRSANGQESTITYNPTVADQMAMNTELGIDGDIVISYDVNHEGGIGDITIVQDTFIHSFSPKDLTPLPKNIIFVIDISGSMRGRKIDQTREAMLTILDQAPTRRYVHDHPLRVQSQVLAVGRTGVRRGVDRPH